MHDFTFENQGSNTYLVYEIKEEDNLDTTSLGMLTNNKITGLAQTTFTQMDETKYIKYNVTARVKVKDFFDSPVNKKQLLGIFSGIVDGILSAEDYMIDINTILLDLSYIYTDVSTYETVLICLPITRQAQERVDLGSFFKNIMFNIQYGETGDYVAQILNYLNSTPVFSLHDFKLIIDKFKNGGSDVKSSEPTFKTKPVEQVAATQPQTIEQVQGKVNYSANAHNPQASAKNSNPKTANSQASNNVPNQKQKEAKNKKEKGMSMFYLLNHYSKENKEIYKAQKAERKANKASQKNTANNKKAANQQKKNPQEDSFTVPGAPSQDVEFAIPGQSTQKPKPSNKPIVQEENIQQSSPTSQTPTQTPKQSESVQSQQTTQQAQNIQTSNMNFGETTVLGGNTAGETTVLNSGQQENKVAIPYLIRTKNTEKIMIDKSVFRLGKEKSYVDYFISDNATISRSHANIITKDDKYFVVDTNSTNHTYVDGKMIQSNSEIEINHGTKIRLANEKFEFRTY